MLLNRDEISADKSFNLLTESILERDQVKTTNLFFKMVESGQSIGDALSVVTAAEAPFVNVPCHINIKDGNIALTNNDHTLLGLRASTYLMPRNTGCCRCSRASGTSARGSTSGISSCSSILAATRR